VASSSYRERSLLVPSVTEAISASTAATFCLNSSLGIVTARDKLRSIQLLARHNIGFPDTIFVKDREAIPPAIEKLGGAPVIIKLLEGTQGIGVILADTNKAAEAIIETLQSTAHVVLSKKDGDIQIALELHWTLFGLTFGSRTLTMTDWIWPWQRAPMGYMSDKTICR